MKKLTLLLLVLAINCALADTKKFSYQATKIVPNNFENIANIAMDIEAYCKKGCKYKIKEIVDVKIVETTDERVYSWSYSRSAAGKFKFYSYANYEYLDDDTIKITNGYPDARTVARLQRDYGLEQDKTPFDYFLAIWTIRRLDEGRSEVTYDGIYESSNPLAGLFSKTI